MRRASARPDTRSKGRRRARFTSLHAAPTVPPRRCAMAPMPFLRALVVSVSCSVCLLACSSAAKAPPAEPDRILARATAHMEARSGSTVTGTVTFVERQVTVDGKPARRLDVRYDLSGLVPG